MRYDEDQGDQEMPPYVRGFYVRTASVSGGTEVERGFKIHVIIFLFICLHLLSLDYRGRILVYADPISFTRVNTLPEKV